MHLATVDHVDAPCNHANMTTNARMEYSLIISIELPDGSTYNLRHVFDSLTVARDVAAWYKRQPDTKYVVLTEVRIAETFKTVEL